MFIATADVDYTPLRLEANTLTFLDGTRVVCSGRYRAANSPEAGDGGAAGGPESYTDTAHMQPSCLYVVVAVRTLAP